MIRGGPVNIPSGAHGEASGLMRAERAFFEADTAAFGGLKGVNVFDITRMTPGEISGLLRGPGTTIGAFLAGQPCRQMERAFTIEHWRAVGITLPSTEKMASLGRATGVRRVW